MLGICSGASGCIHFLRFSAASMNGASSACFRASRSGLPGLEHRHHLGGEQLERVDDVLVLVAARLLDEHHLVDAGVLILPQPLDRAAPACRCRCRAAGGSAARAASNRSQTFVTPGLCWP